MAIWLPRAGSNGEHELKFVKEKRIYLTWDDLNIDIAKLNERADLISAITRQHPTAKVKTIASWVGQIWPFAHEIKKSDLVILPLKKLRAIQIGKVTGDYHFEPNGPNPYFHWRPVKWIGKAIPRTHFRQDLLNTFGAFRTICRVQSNNAEVRIAAMQANDWKPEKR